MQNDEKLIIEGLAGKRSLSGAIEINGAKNAALKVLASSLLFKDSLRLTNVPEIEDIIKLIEILEDLGVKVEKEEGGYFCKTNNIDNNEISPEISKHLRASIVLSGPLLARTGRVVFPYPGGCVIGKRPIDFFLEAFQSMGASVISNGFGYEITTNGKLQGAELFFRVPSVTNTETFMMAGVLAEGKTVIKNAAMEPEIISLGEFLNQCGARISGLGTPTIEIEGGELLSGENQVYETIPDRIEAGSFMILAALAGEDIELRHLNSEHLDSLFHLFKQSGVRFEKEKDKVRFRNQSDNFTALEIKTHEYPGFPTDLQAPMAVFLTQTEGQSYIFETIFEGRLNYLETLERMGAEARIIDVHRALITGPTALSGLEMESPDLRAGLAYVLAGIIASGTSIVHNVHYIDRGYEAIEDRLEAIGVNIKRLK